jgi:hypothetical protein
MRLPCSLCVCLSVYPRYQLLYVFFFIKILYLQSTLDFFELMSKFALSMCLE